MIKLPRSRYTVRNNLSLRFSLGVAVLTVVMVLVGYVAGAWIPFGWSLALLAIVAGIVSYFATQVFLIRRIDVARKTLRQFRKGNFKRLKKRKLPRGDALDELIRQVYRIGFTMQGEIKRLKRVENYRKEFLGDVSHELRTPIFAVQGFAETLLDGALEDQRVNRSFLEKIVRHAERLHHLVEDLSYISLIETGEMLMHMGTFSFAGIAREVLESAEAIGREEHVRIKSELPLGLDDVVGDRDRIRQVVSNLVENALKYNRPDGSVTLGAESQQDFVRIYVTDTGMGIPPEHIPRITQRFYRVDKSRSREQGGTGLGLAIVKHILEAHGQRLRIESTEGVGSTFSFVLPKASLSM